MIATISNRVWIKETDLGGPSEVQSLADRLIVYPRSTSPYDKDPEPIELFERRDGYIGIPREYFVQKNTGKFQVELKLAEGHPFSKQFDPIMLRDYQIEPVSTVVEAFKAGRLGGVLEAGAGTGKTIDALEIARRLGRSTLILLHKEFLADQWIERINQFLPGAKIGRVQQDQCDFQGKDFVVGMIQSLISRQYPPSLYGYFSLVVVDECHRISSPSFSKAIVLFNPKNILGISATPSRKDRTEKVFLWNIGPIISKVKHMLMVPKVRRIRTKLRIAPKPGFNPEAMSDAVINRILAHNAQRTGLIAAKLAEAADAGRKIIVFSDLRKHLLWIAKAFKSIRPSVTFDFYVGEWYDDGMFAQGDSKERMRKRSKEELEKAKEAQVLFASYAMAKEGMDHPGLDTVFLASPKSDVIQTVGRILRSSPDKKQPIVVDFIDESTGRLKAMASARVKWYQKIGALEILQT